MKIAVTGASGLIGTAVVEELTRHGHEVLRLVRRAPRGPGEVRWDPAAGVLDVDALAGVGGAVNLSGAGVGDHRWTEDYRRQILTSRVDSTVTLSRALARLRPLPAVLVSASAEGVYGSDRGEEVITEDSSLGDGFLADVVRAWEAAAAPAREAGIRVVHPRTGLVMSRRGGALARMVPIYKLGAGGPLGSGRQWWSHISLADEAAALRHLLETDSAEGWVNVAAPVPARNKEFSDALARAVHRRAFLPAPALALKVVLDGFAGEVLGGVRLSTERLAATGFTAQHPDADAVVAAALRD